MQCVPDQAWLELKTLMCGCILAPLTFFLNVGAVVGYIVPAWPVRRGR
jgi:hypothetical protein